MTNRCLGNEFETRLCNILFGKGFWCHNFAQNHSGQPADIIAVKNCIAYLIDCKVCSNDIFPLSRIESNQALSMEHWTSCGNDVGWFAFLLSDDTIHFIPHTTMRAISQLQSSLSERLIKEWGIALPNWVMNRC